MTFNLPFKPRLWLEQNRPVLIRHGLCWSLLIVYESVSVYMATGQFRQPADYLIFYLLNIALFYVNALAVLPIAFRNKYPYLMAVTLILVEMMIYMALKAGTDFLIDQVRQAHHQYLSYDRRYLVYNLWRGLYFLGFSTLYWSVLRMLNLRDQITAAEHRHLQYLIERSDLEKNLAVTHNAYLQQQINPHFLFNTLNLIYQSFYQLSDTAATCVAKLSAVMRYTYDPVDLHGKSELSAEIEQIRNLIELNRMRFNFALYFDLHILGEITDQRIPRLVLLSLAENMFKHGYLKNEAEPAYLTIELSDGHTLSLRSRNQKKKRGQIQQGFPTGLSNITKRLDYTYPDNYRLHIQDTEDTFQLELNINL